MSSKTTRKPSTILSLALPLALLAGGCNKGDQPDPQVTAKLEAIRKAGLPVTLSELNAWYVEPPAAENSAPGYNAAFAAMSSSKYTDPGFLAENQKALQLLHAAASRVKCRYPIDLKQGSGTLMVHLPKVKMGAQLLAAEALDQARKRATNEAERALLDEFNLAGSLDDEPVMISHLVQIAAETILQRGVEAVLNQKTLSEDQLARLQTASHEAERRTSFTRALAGERAMAIDIFQKFQRSSAVEKAKVLASLGVALEDESQKKRYREGYPQITAFNADFNFHLDRIDELLESSRMSFPQALAGLSDWTNRVEAAVSKGYLISGAFLPSMSQVPVKEAGVIGRLRLMQVALALERFRLAHGDALPESLSELTPKFLGTIPSDPFDGKPLRYLKLPGKGYSIYSVDADRQDDHGKRRPEDGSAGDSGYDLTFIVRR